MRVVVHNVCIAAAVWPNDPVGKCERDTCNYCVFLLGLQTAFELSLAALSPQTCQQHVMCMAPADASTLRILQISAPDCSPTWMATIHPAIG